MLLGKHPDITVLITSRGRLLTSTLKKKEALETSSCILNFTDKAKVVMKKLLNEDLTHVRIKGKKNEIIVIFNDLMEIATIRNEK